MINESSDTFDGLLDDVKTGFFLYEPKPLFELHSFRGIAVADERDIGAMKRSAISSRGNKKDIIYLFFLLKKYSIFDLMEVFQEKYCHIEYSTVHLLKSLAYFEDAETELMPKMLVDTSWEEIKEHMVREANGFLRSAQ